MEKNDLALLKAENDRLLTDLEKLKQRLREEITRTQAGVRLDLNLEKGARYFFLCRHLGNCTDRGILSECAGRLRDESGSQELKIREVETRIETDIAALRTAIQTSKVTSASVKPPCIILTREHPRPRHCNTW